MRRISVPSCSCTAGRRMGSTSWARRVRTPVGRPRWTAPTASTSLRWIGSSRRCGVRKGNRRSVGRSMSTAPKNPGSLCSLVVRTVRPVRPGRPVPGRSTKPGASNYRRGSTMRPSRPCGCGMPVPRANASMRAARGSKGPSHRGCGPSGCGRPAFGASRKPTCSTSRRLPRSISTGLWPGSTSVHAPQRVPPVLQRWRLSARSLLGRRLTQTIADLPRPMAAS